MTQQPAARRAARPLALLACALLALCTTACAPFLGGPMNPLIPRVKSVEAFQRDIEPAIIAARNELVTEENFVAYKNNYTVNTLNKNGKLICSFHSRMFSSPSWIRITSATPTMSASSPSGSNYPNNAGPPTELRSSTTCGLTRSTRLSCRRRHDSEKKPPRTITRRALPRTDPTAIPSS